MTRLLALLILTAPAALPQCTLPPLIEAPPPPCLLVFLRSAKTTRAHPFFASEPAKVSRAAGRLWVYDLDVPAEWKEITGKGWDHYLPKLPCLIVCDEKGVLQAAPMMLPATDAEFAAGMKIKTFTLYP